MSKMILDFDPVLCCGCGACAVACMDQNDLKVKEGARPFRNVFDMERQEGEGTVYSHLSLACMHCADAPCIVGCPSACIKKDPDTNLTVFDTTNCIGCHSCAMACPYGVPGFGEDGRMVTCGRCNGQEKRPLPAGRGRVFVLNGRWRYRYRCRRSGRSGRLWSQSRPR